MFTVMGTTTVDIFISGLETTPQIDGDEFTSSSLAYCTNPLTLTLGGNGANTAYVLAALGAPVALLSATGLDPLGETVSTWLKAKQVDMRGFLRKEGGTATTTTVISPDQNRLSYYYPGTFPTYNADYVPSDLIADSDLFLINGYALLPGFSNLDFKTLLATAKQAGVLTALDIGPALGKPPTIADLEQLFPHLDYFIANDYEIASYLGVNDPRSLLGKGASCVVIKQGIEGVTLLDAVGQICVKGFPLHANVTIGAGDSFNAGFLYGLDQGMTLPDAARFGNATAALVIGSGQSVRGAPTLAQVESLLSKTNPLGE